MVAISAHVTPSPIPYTLQETEAKQLCVQQKMTHGNGKLDTRHLGVIQARATWESKAPDSGFSVRGQGYHPLQRSLHPDTHDIQLFSA
jgi:hypothetical protein